MELAELKEALEYQVDIVLRLEEERLLLSKENQMQKDKLREANQILQKYLGQHLMQVDKAQQTSTVVLVEKPIQTDNDDMLSDYTLSNSQISHTQSQLSIPITTTTTTTKLNAIDEAKQLLKQSTQRKPVKQLKFCGDSYKENKPTEKQTIEKKKPDTSQAEALTREIMNLTKQVQQHKLLQRGLQDQLKKYEKENQDVNKHLEVKNEMLNKLRNENAEMAILINQDKFKSVRMMDNELKSEREHRVKLQHLLQEKTDDNYQLQQDLTQFREVLGKLTSEFEKHKVQEQHCSIIEEQNHQSHESMLIRDATINELKQVNEQLNQEVEYFRAMSLKQKEITSQQDEDLQFYRELLVKHNVLQP